MLPQEFRLKHTRDFDTVWKDGVFVNGALITMKYWNIRPERFPRRAYRPDDLRIGFAVGVKISKKAVERNRLKRQMREAVRLLLKDGCIKHGFLVAFVAKPAMLGAEYREIEKEMMTVLKRAGLYVNKK